MPFTVAGIAVLTWLVMIFRGRNGSDFASGRILARMPFHIWTRDESW